MTPTWDSPEGKRSVTRPVYSSLLFFSPRGLLFEGVEKQAGSNKITHRHTRFKSRAQMRPCSVCIRLSPSRTVSSNKNWLAAASSDSFPSCTETETHKLVSGKPRHKQPTHAVLLSPFRSFHRVCFNMHAGLLPFSFHCFSFCLSLSLSLCIFL